MENLNTVLYIITGISTINLGLMLIMWQFMNSKFDKIDSRFDKIDSRFDKLDEKITDIDRRVCRIEGAMGNQPYLREIKQANEQ